MKTILMIFIALLIWANIDVDAKWLRCITVLMLVFAITLRMSLG